MNFISEMEGGEVQLELKYCERCGGLGLRPQGSEGAYCGSCQRTLDARPTFEIAPTRKRRRRPRPGGFNSERNCLPNEAQIECLQGVAAMGMGA
jgi:hypothetical protein